MVALYSEELLFAWSGDFLDATWGAEILFWYAMGCIFLMLSYFQYYLQFARGELKYYIKSSTIFGLLTVLIMVISAYQYGAIGTSIAWFLLQLAYFIFFPAFIHMKFEKGLHEKWIFKDIAPFAMLNITLLMMLKGMDIEWIIHSRVEIFSGLLLIGICMLMINLVLLKNLAKPIDYIPLKR